MLQRAASNAYSWWWASHIRTKQSKWLDENLQGMEERVADMIKIIENQGDTFRQRAEMYYKRRPELIGHVEDSYRAYRALAERYDKLSKEMQSANRTLATIFPEQFQFMEDEDFDENENHPPPPQSSSADEPDKKEEPKPSKANIPKSPSLPKKDFRSQSMLPARKVSRLTRTATSKASAPPKSGLTREEALEEIDKIQKEILALQTEKEFVQSVADRCHAKYQRIEDQMTEMQDRVGKLQDEFGLSNIIDDDEARSLMAARALKTCKQTLAKLQEKQERSADEAKVENERINEVNEKLQNLRLEINPDLANVEETNEENAGKSENAEENNVEVLREKIKKDLDENSNSTFTVMQLAERIDELVDKVAKLETAVSSQGALVNILRSETDGLQSQIKTLEEEKETLMENSEHMNHRLKELEDELRRVKNLNQNIKDHNTNLQTHITVASCNVDHLSDKLETATPDEEVTIEEHERSKKLKQIVEEYEKVDDLLSNDSSHQVEKPERKELLETDSNVDAEPELHGMDDPEELNWRQLYMGNLEDREKLLVEEYTAVLRNYNEVRKKLNDVEKKNRDGFFELVMQIRELKTAVSKRDEEIQNLRKKSGDAFDHSTTYSQQGGSPESMTQTASFPNSDVLSQYSPAPDSEFSLTGEKIKAKHGESPRPVSAVEEKIRSEIDEILEANLEFWLRFSTSFHQIRKFQTSIQDLKGDLAKLKTDMKKDGSSKVESHISEARPIYNHLREIETELTLWLENNTVLKDELRTRYGSMCNIQDELSKVCDASSKAAEVEISDNQAAKFQGELLNMKQENTKVAEELRAGVERVILMKVEIEKLLTEMDEDFGISTANKQRSTSSKARIPLRSFLFGVKLRRQKRPSLFSCVSPSLSKQYSIMASVGKPSE